MRSARTRLIVLFLAALQSIQVSGQEHLVSNQECDFDCQLILAKRMLSNDADSSYMYALEAQKRALNPFDPFKFVFATSMIAKVHRYTGSTLESISAVEEAQTLVNEKANEIPEEDLVEVNQMLRAVMAFNQVGRAQEVYSSVSFSDGERIAADQEAEFKVIINAIDGFRYPGFRGHIYLAEAIRHKVLFNSDSTLKYSSLAADEFRLANDTSELANTYILSSLAFHQKDEYLKMLLMLETAKEIVMQLDEQGQMGVIASLTGKAYGELSGSESALEMLQSSDSLLQNLKDITSQKIVLKNLANLSEDLGLYEQALDYFRRLSDLNLAEQTINANVEIEEIQAKYDVAEKNRQLLESEKETQMAVGVLLILLVLLLAGVVIFLVYRSKQRTKTLSQERQMSELMRQQELVAVNAMLEGQETERKRIGQDLHDNIGSLLATARMQVSAAKDGQDAQIDNVSEILDEAASEVRKISHNLVSGTLSKFGLIPAIKELAERIDTTTNLEVSFTSIGMDGRLSAMQEVNLYRIAQELISNAIKHSFASKLKIKVQKQSKEILLQIKDDGIGLSNETNANLSGVGLKNIQGRVNALSGSFDMVSEPGKGTQSNIRIPITENIPVHAEN